MISVLLMMAAFGSQPEYVLTPNDTPYQRTMAVLAQSGVSNAKSDKAENKVCYINGMAYSPGTPSNRLR